MFALSTVLETATDAPVNAGMQSWFSIAMIVVVFVVFYFFGIRPQKKQQKAEAKMRSELQIGDEICRIDGYDITTAEDVRRALKESDGSVDVTVLRSGKERQLHMEPEITPDGPKLGVYLRQGITGIGTVTWYDPDTGKFGAPAIAQNGTLDQNKQRFLLQDRLLQPLF